MPVRALILMAILGRNIVLIPRGIATTTTITSSGVFRGDIEKRVQGSGFRIQSSGSLIFYKQINEVVRKFKGGFSRYFS